MVAAAEKSGLTIMPILGEFAWPYYRHDPPIPAYAQLKVTEHAVGGRRVRVAWPKLDAWKEYVRALTSHYKGRITHWEVMNEPNLMMTSEEYVPYLQAAYAAAKEGNPDCKIVGVCATSDFAGKPGSFTDAALKLDGAKSFDLLSVHLYHTTPPERSLDTGSDVLLERWRKTLRENYGRDIPVWHTERSYISRELGYSSAKVNVPLEYCDEPQFLIDSFKHKAEYLIRETLMDAVAGAGGTGAASRGGRFFWFGLFNAENTFITIRSFQPYGLDHNESDGSPCPELLAANGLARALEGMSHPARQLNWGGSTRCVVFTGEEGCLAAVWDAAGTGRASIPANRSAVALRDFFGEPMQVAPDNQGRLEVPLAGAVKYLAFPGMKLDECCRVLEAAQLR
jgi:hypothetical protein